MRIFDLLKYFTAQRHITAIHTETLLTGRCQESRCWGQQVMARQTCSKTEGDYGAGEWGRGAEGCAWGLGRRREQGRLEH